MRASRLLVYLVLAGLLARVIYLGQAASLPFFHEPVGDSARYLDRAREIAAGHLAGDRPFFYGGIFYPWLIALNLILFGANLYPIGLLQAGAGCALAWVIYRLARAAAREDDTGRRLGLLAAGMALFYGPFAFFESDLLMISWTLLLMMAGALAMLESIRRPGRRAGAALAGAAGICLGLAATERPNLLALLPALAVWAIVCAPSGRRLAAAIPVLAGGALVLGGVAALNHAASGRWVMLTTSSGINFYIGNHEGAEGTFDEPWSASDPEFTASHFDLEESSVTMARRISGRDLDAVQASSFWRDRGLEFLAGHPGEAARLYLRKLALFWGAREVPNHLDFEFMRQTAPALWLMPLGFALVAPAALYGVAVRGARRLIDPRALALLLLLVLVPAVTVLPFFVADRYRVPVVPPLMILAACGLLALGQLASARLTRRRASLHAACLALVAVAMSQPLAEPDRSRNEWMMAQAFRKQGRLEEARAHYERALAASPDSAVLHNSLGVLLAQMGRPDRAEAEYRRAVELGPALALPHRNLGLILMRGGADRGGEALEHLVIAERADPADLEVARAMAALLMARGDAAGARERALKVLRAAPDDPGARAVLKAADGPPPQATPPPARP